MKFSVSMYSYMQKIRSGEATPFELIAKTKELGFEDAVVVFLEPRREARPHNDRP